MTGRPTGVDSAAHSRLSEVLDASADVVLIATVAGDITYANRAAQNLLPADDAEYRLEQLFAAASRETFASVALPATLSEGFWQGELDLDVGGAYSLPAAVTVLGHGNDDGTVEYLSLIAHDITELKHAQQVLRDQASHDALTGLPNRAMLTDQLVLALARCERSADAPALMFCDLDGFKAVNDSLGHEAGDQLLIEVGRRLIDCVRGVDVVARFGGDEFVVLLDGVTELAIAQQIADRVIASVQQPFDVDGGTARVGVSIGIAVWREGASAETLFGEADAAMYRAKQLGKHRHQAFDDELRARAAARSKLKTDLAQALARNEFWVLYAPVASVDDGRLCALEAGMRWVHRHRGLLGPSEFMPLARELNIARDLDRFVLDEVGAHAAIWNASRTNSEPLTVWVTVGMHDLIGGDLERRLARLIDVAKLAEGALGIEVPLPMLTKHPAEVQRALRAVSRAGVRVAIDDFGTDAFSPAQMQSFPIDAVKLDRRLVAALADSPVAVNALAGVVAIARALGLLVVAKGVDARETLELLQELGCHQVQGTVVARPQRAPKITPLVEGVAPWAAAEWPSRAAEPAGLTRAAATSDAA